MSGDKLFVWCAQQPGVPARKYSTLSLISGFAQASFKVAVSYQIGARVA
jgi:hypothetical protein